MSYETKRMTLERNFCEALELYKSRGHDENSWQWQDEGSVYAIMDYLSSCEMTEDDWKFAREKGIDDIVRSVMQDED